MSHGTSVFGQSSSRLRAAVIGHTGRGDYGHGLEGIFANRPNIELVALADADDAGRAKMAAKLGVGRSYRDYREMLEREQPKLVSLGMRHADQHHEVGLAVLKAGAHLYCEKPFARTPAEADELLAEADRRGLKIAVAHTMRIAPATERLRRSIAEGLIGELTEIRTYGKQDSRAGGEDMMVLGSHLFDLMRLFAGDPLWCTARVLAAGRDITRTDVRYVKDNVGRVAGDQVFAQFAFERGVQASFASSAALREVVGHWGLEFWGSKGVARLNCDIAPHAFVRKPSAWSSTGRTDPWEPIPSGPAPTSATHNLGPVDDWLDAIARDREPACSGRNGAWAIEMVSGVYHAALSSTRIQFPLKVRTDPLG